MYKHIFITLTLILLIGGLLISVILSNLKTVSPRKLFRIKRAINETQLQYVCNESAILSIKDHIHDDIERYCRCSDGSYGFTCEKRFPNPCHKEGKFDISPKSIPDNFFVHCSNGMPYLFKCPGLLKWDHTLLTCTHIVHGLTAGKVPLYSDKVFTHFAKKFGLTAEHLKSENWKNMKQDFLQNVNPKVITKKLGGKLDQMFGENLEEPIDLTNFFELTSEYLKIQDELKKGELTKTLSIDDTIKSESSQRYLNNLLTELETYTNKLYRGLNIPNLQMSEEEKDLKKEKEQLFNQFIEKIGDLKDDLVKYLEPASSKKQKVEFYKLDENSDRKRDGMRIAESKSVFEMEREFNLRTNIKRMEELFAKKHQKTLADLRGINQNKKLVSAFLNSRSLKETVAEFIHTENKTNQDKKLEETIINTVTNVLQTFIDNTDLSQDSRSRSEGKTETLIDRLLKDQDKSMRSTGAFGSSNNFFSDEFRSPPKGQFLNNQETPFIPDNAKSQLFKKFFNKKHFDMNLSQNTIDQLKASEIAHQSIKVERVLDKQTLDQRLEALNTHSLHTSPLFYWVDMPHALGQNISSLIVGDVLKQLSRESSPGIKILFNFPPTD